MEPKKRFSISRQKSYLTAGVIALAAVIAMAGIYYKDRRADAQQEAIAMAENEKIEDAGTKANTNEGENEDESDENEISSDAPENQGVDDLDAVEEEKPSENHVLNEVQNVETVAQPAEPVLHFSAGDHIEWPINGDVVLNYSMDQSVYFATLDQYKYNPAVVIRGAVNDKVVAAADGQVIGVDTNAETGLTVTVGMGDGYQAVYGQLKEVSLEAGDYISKGDIIGYINEPTKYYSVEGSNLYFAMTKDGEPINPMDYFE